VACHGVIEPLWEPGAIGLPARERVVGALVQGDAALREELTDALPDTIDEL
jgi:hypothetical protein